MIHRAALLQELRNGRMSQQAAEQFPFYPLTAPGMPLPGPNFVAAAVGQGDDEPVYEGQRQSDKTLIACGVNLPYLYHRALYDEQFTMPVSIKSGVVNAPMVPGHLLGADTANGMGGPRPADVMILGKMPGKDDVAQRRNFVGESAQILMDALDEWDVGRERDAFYVDNLVHWPQLDPQSDSLPMAHKKDCNVLLQQTLRLVRPKYLLCLGSDASKWLLGTSYGVQAMTGRVEEIIIPLHSTLDEEPCYHTIKVMAATAPGAVWRTPETYPEFRAQVGQFIALTRGADIGKQESFIDHRNIYKHRELKAIVDEIMADPDPWRRVIAVDGEWEGEHPGNPGSYLRNIQFSSKHGEGINVVLRHQGGEPAFKPSIGHAIHELTRLLKRDPDRGWFPRPGGHFLRADLPWLIAEGLDIREEYAPPDSPELCRTEGGFDTGLQYHAVNETASYRLTDMTVRLTSAPVYDTRLKAHITGYCAAHNIKKEDLEGYGFLPQWILHPEPTDPEWGDNYAQYDPDVTRRIAIEHMKDGGLLDSDWNGISSWEPYWRSHCASLGVLEMEMTGIKLDRDRVDRLTTLFIYARDRLLAHFREQIGWPDFNPESTPQCVAFLFGDDYSKKVDKTTGQRISIRPPGSITLGLTPVKSTGRRSKLWADIITRGEQHKYTPSSDKEVLGILGHENPLAMMLRDLKFITQVLKGPLRPPVLNEDGTGWKRDAQGALVYDKGLAAAAQHDGKVHTHISQNKETGRGASSRPPLQNISKRREGDYSRILGTEVTNEEGVTTVRGDYVDVFEQALYLSPIRTIFCAEEGHVLVEADYTGAELAGIAWLADDPNMIEHVRRNALPESDPLHYDIHSHTAVDTFQLQCDPTKKGLKNAGHSPLRVAAKNVNFGIPYGRSAEAIARQCKEEGVEVSVDDCQAMIDQYFVRYPGTAAFLAECRRRSQEDRWMAGSFGRMRRFIPAHDRGVIGEQERQSQNFPIQNMVADAIWLAIYNFHKHKQDNPQYGYKLLLQIHDALLFQVPISELQDFLQNVLRQHMVQRVPIWPRYLDNTPMNVAEPYHFGIDYDVQVNWGEDPSDELLSSLGIQPEVLVCA